jgi:uncharacterized protein
VSPAPRAGAGPSPLSDDELDELQSLLDAVPAPLDPLDTSMLDGFLCGVLVQPAPISASRWLPFVTDSDGRALPAGFDASRLHALALRRHAELDAAIEARRWFDPWIFEVDADASDPAATDTDPEDADDAAPSEAGAVYPWVAGFVTALDRFPALMSRSGQALDAALVLLYRHLDPDDLEDADEILQAIEELEPPENLGVAVEELVRATLLLADIGRPRREGTRRPARKGRPRR